MDKKPYYSWHLKYVINQSDLSLLSEEEFQELGELALLVCEKLAGDSGAKNPAFFRW